MNRKEENHWENVYDKNSEIFGKNKRITEDTQEKPTPFYNKQQAQLHRTFGRSPDKKYGY
ncbi:hypothetical protein [Aneurinibacillus danicus]|jgi:hypothetical protein|uniref:Uncharacterized protein n=1 Tax=Aneurinibacillus danicus TaxID=267746 RepID=A0A511VDS6_9BACL|nr:hypothetical protein [Aneurinibacillus danicus]GEN35422.1 hypothetical protein ADA01nite_28820 [Aneurinibacillus danicus]